MVNAIEQKSEQHNRISYKPQKESTNWKIKEYPLGFNPTQPKWAKLKAHYESWRREEKWKRVPSSSANPDECSYVLLGKPQKPLWSPYYYAFEEKLESLGMVEIVRPTHHCTIWLDKNGVAVEWDREGKRGPP